MASSPINKVTSSTGQTSKIDTRQSSKRVAIKPSSAGDFVPTVSKERHCSRCGAIDHVCNSAACPQGSKPIKIPLSSVSLSNSSVTVCDIRLPAIKVLQENSN